MAAEPIRKLFTTSEYYTMLEAGILAADDRVELIEGEIWRMAPIGSRHAGCVTLLDRLFQRNVGDGALVRAQHPLRLDDYSEPEPDIVLVHYRDDFYVHAHPAPADAFLVIEVADSSTEYDRRVKVPLYARNGITETWLVNLDKSVLEVYRNPAFNSYKDVRHLRAGDQVSPLAFPELTLDVAALLG
jgi:Uma2 family endonuclease